MADKPISSLPVAAALSGADLLAVVQAGSTKKATVTQVYNYVLSQASGPAAGDTIVKRDSFGTIAATGLYAVDDGFGGGGFLSLAHHATIGGHCTVGDYLQVASSLIMANPTGTIQWPNSGSGFHFGPDGTGAFLYTPETLHVGADFRVGGAIAFGTYAAATGVITGSIAVKDKTGTTVNLMAFL